MKTWNEFSNEAPAIARMGRGLLFPTRAYVGHAFIATLRKDGAPRLHPISLIFHQDHLYVMIPPASPKCADLIRDGRYALQAYPPQENEEGREFYLAGRAVMIRDSMTRQALMEDTRIVAKENEVLFELFLERAMHTMLADRTTLDERPIHRIWKTTEHKPREDGTMDEGDSSS